MKQPAVYIMTNKRNGSLYTGVTSDLIKRCWQHRNAITTGFTTKYDCKLLVWYELHPTMVSAIFQEKQLKPGSRQKKRILIERMNLDWDDLYPTLT